MVENASGQEKFDNNNKGKIQLDGIKKMYAFILFLVQNWYDSTQISFTSSVYLWAIIKL